MNNLSFILYSIIVLVVVIVLVIIIILILNKSNETEVKIETREKDFFVSLPNTYNLKIPLPIEKMSVVEVKDIARKVYDSFKVFDYKKMDNYKFEEKEWHNWQVSMLLMVYKKNEELILPNQEKVFHDMLLNASENDIKSLMRDIIRKYELDVDIDKSRDDLCKEYLWSNKEVSVIFYFLANYKNFTA